MKCLKEIMRKYFNLLRDHDVWLTQVQEYLYNNSEFPHHTESGESCWECWSPLYLSRAR